MLCARAAACNFRALARQPRCSGATGQDLDRSWSSKTVGDVTMSLFTLREKLVAASILVGGMVVAPMIQAVAQQKAAPPDFSSNNVGGLTFNGNFSIVP